MKGVPFQVVYQRLDCEFSMALSELTFRCRRDLMEFRSELFLARGAECGLQELTRVSTFGTGKAHGFKPSLSLG
jgi:hypothetical protein